MRRVLALLAGLMTIASSACANDAMSKEEIRRLPPEKVQIINQYCEIVGRPAIVETSRANSRLDFSKYGVNRALPSLYLSPMSTNSARGNAPHSRAYVLRSYNATQELCAKSVRAQRESL
jgi:hypothetical protein